MPICNEGLIAHAALEGIEGEELRTVVAAFVNDLVRDLLRDVLDADEGVPDAAILIAAVTDRIWVTLLRGNNELALSLAENGRIFKTMHVDTLLVLASVFNANQLPFLEIAVCEEAISRPVKSADQYRTAFSAFRSLSMLYEQVAKPEDVVALNHRLLLLIDDLEAKGLHTTDGAINNKLQRDRFFAQHRVYKHAALGGDESFDEGEKRAFYEGKTAAYIPPEVRRTSFGVLRKMAADSGDKQGALQYAHKRMKLLRIDERDPDKNAYIDKDDEDDVVAYLDLANDPENFVKLVELGSPLQRYSTRQLEKLCNIAEGMELPLLEALLHEELASREFLILQKPRHLKKAGVLYRNNGQTEKALVMFKELLSLLNESGTDRDLRAYAMKMILELRYKLGEVVSDDDLHSTWKTVIKDFTANHWPIIRDAYYNLAYFCWNRGRKEEALNTLRAGLDDPRIRDTSILQRAWEKLSSGKARIRTVTANS